MFHFKLVSISGVQFDDEVYEVMLPTLDGEIGVLKDHMPLVSVAKNGAIAIRRQAKDPDWRLEYYATNGGVIEVSDNDLRVLVDEADNAEDINEAEEKAAMERAERMKADAKDEIDIEQAQAVVDRSSVRLHVASLKRRHQRR